MYKCVMWLCVVVCGCVCVFFFVYVKFVLILVNSIVVSFFPRGQICRATRIKKKQLFLSYQ
jgi:hypothetical protein